MGQAGGSFHTGCPPNLVTSSRIGEEAERSESEYDLCMLSIADSDRPTLITPESACEQVYTMTIDYGVLMRAQIRLS